MHTLRKEELCSLKVCDYVLLTVSRVAAVLPVHGHSTNNILALLFTSGLSFPEGC